MSIVREYGEYFPVCDICEERGEPFAAWGYARDWMVDEGWDSKKDNGVWIDVCQNCLEMEQMKCNHVGRGKARWND